MVTVRLSRNYGLVLPATVRTGLGLKPGQGLHVRRNGSRIEIVPVRAPSARKAATAGARRPARNRRRSVAALEAQDRAGYERLPEDRDDWSVGDSVFAWPEE